MAKIHVDTIELPAHWASLYINGDDSGMEQVEVEAAEWALMKLQNKYPGARIVDCSFDSYIGRYNEQLTEMLTYTIHHDGK